MQLIDPSFHRIEAKNEFLHNQSTRERQNVSIEKCNQKGKVKTHNPNTKISACDTEMGLAGGCEFIRLKYG